MTGRPTSWSEVPLALTVDEAAEILKIGRNGCYALVASGQLSAVRLGRRIVVPREAVERLLAISGTPESDAMPANELGVRDRLGH
jgi:excisionase family DNA binding protein